MSLFDKLLLNSASIFTAKMLEGLLQLAVLAFILTQMERELYAAALLIISIQATIELARAGMQKATLKYIAEYKAKGAIAASNKALSSSSALQGGVGLLGLLICIGLSPFGAEIFALPDHLQKESQWALVLMGFGIAATFAVSPWHNSVAALERYDLLSLARVCGKLIRAGLIMLLLLSGSPGLISLVLATVVGNISERVICIGFIRRISPDLVFSIRDVRIAHIRTMLGFSVFDFFHTLSGLLYSQGSLFLAAHLLSLKAVAGLGIIANLTALTGLLMHQFAQMLVPIASRLNAQGQTERLRALVTHGTTVTVFCGGAVVTALVPWVDSILATWLGRGYSDLTHPAIVLIVATFLVNSLTCIHNSLGGIGKVAVDGISNTASTVIGLIAAAVLCTVFDMALLGLATGMLFARLLRFFFISLYGVKHFEYKLSELMWNGYLKSFLLISIASLVGMQTGYEPDSWLTLVIAAGLTSSSYFFTGLFWIVDPADRRRFSEAFINAVGYKKGKRHTPVL